MKKLLVYLMISSLLIFITVNFEGFQYGSDPPIETVSSLDQFVAVNFVFNQLPLLAHNYYTGREVLGPGVINKTAIDIYFASNHDTEYFYYYISRRINKLEHPELYYSIWE